MVPASIRNNNPGAMWGGPSAKKYGAVGAVNLADGLGQSNEIARFRTPILGAAALFDLLCRAYCGLTLRAAISKWSGGNHVSAYLRTIGQATGLSPGDKLTREYLATPQSGIALAAAMARHEAGREYPLTYQQWMEAHAMAFGIPAADGPGSIGGRGNAAPAASNATASEAFGGESMDIPRHLEIAIAYKKAGLKEYPGRRHNPDVLRLFHLCGHPEIKTDETAWCAAFVGGCLAEAERQGTGSLMAKSYMRWGVPVRKKASAILPGDVVVMDRGSDKRFGHVEFVKRVLPNNRVECLGGNVKNMVKLTSRPIAGLLAVRRAPPVDGARPVLPTVTDSPTLSMQFNGLLAALGSAIYTAWDWLSTTASAAMTLLPGVADTVSTTVGAGQTITTSAGLEWPSILGFAFAAVCFATAFGRLLLQRLGVIE